MASETMKCLQVAVETINGWAVDSQGYVTIHKDGILKAVHAAIVNLQATEGSTDYQRGVAAMQAAELIKVQSWHVAKWNDQPTLTTEEVHELLNAIAGDIMVANP